MYIIDVYYYELEALDQNETLKFFCELKVDQVKASKLYQNSFKVFIKNLIFDEALFESLEIKFKTIKENLVI